MHRRRDRLHHAQALIRAAAVLIAAGCAAVLPVRADTVRIAEGGTVYRVDVVPYATADGSGTALRYTRQDPDGTEAQSYIPGTDDIAVDRDPAIEIDPTTGLPVLVWSRDTGSEYDLFFSQFDGAAWSTGHVIAPTHGDAFEPQIKFGTGVLHLAWREVSPWGHNALVRWSVDPVTMQTVYGPETVSLDDPSPIPPSGGTSGAPTPCRLDHFFVGHLPGTSPGDPGRMYVWGVRDEPVPITFHQSFLLPPDAGSIGTLGIGWLGGRFTLWFESVSQSRVYYTVRSDSGWTAMRAVNLEDGVTVGDARILIHDVNRLGP